MALLICLVKRSLIRFQFSNCNTLETCPIDSAASRYEPPTLNNHLSAPVKGQQTHSLVSGKICMTPPPPSWTFSLPLPSQLSSCFCPWTLFTSYTRNVWRQISLKIFVQNGSDWWHPIKYVWPNPIILHGCTCWIVSKIPHLPVPFPFLFSAEMPQYECFKFKIS